MLTKGSRKVEWRHGAAHSFTRLAKAAMPVVASPCPISSSTLTPNLELSAPPHPILLHPQKSRFVLTKAARSLSTIGAAAMQAPATNKAHLSHEEQRIAEKEPDGDLESLARLEYRRIQDFLDTEFQDPILQDTQKQTRASLRIAQDAVARFGLDGLSFSYNGGKDCLVMLIIYLAAIHAQQLASPGSAPLPSRLRSVYTLPPHQFPEVDAFVKTSAAHYQLELSSSDKPMKEAFAEYLAQNGQVKAIFVGTRRTDPHGATLKHFDPTDHGWPAFVRIHPVIDWHYREVWTFLRHLQIPYCSLYDKGYTSLGGTNDTAPNPKLKNPDATAGPEFLPAYKLVEDDEERLGRE